MPHLGRYYRPLVETGPIRPDGALTLAGGWTWFSRVEVLARGRPSRIIPVGELPESVAERLCAPRAPVAGLSLTRPNLMGILNVTPDSFSDGGLYTSVEAAVGHAQAMIAAGADILDIGGESTRPGAETVHVEDEIARTAPVIRAIRAASRVPISIDTRKAAVALAALEAGVTLINDVSAFTYDPSLAQTVGASGAPACLMHAQGSPENMQEDPRYDDVLLDVYDYLSVRVSMAEASGIPRARLLVDPGIGFGKTQAHNLLLLQRLSLFHGLGCGVLLGASRKRFIGTIGKAPVATDRTPGSIAVALAGVAQGVQVLRVHDIKETAQALALWRAVQEGGVSDDA